MSALRSILKSLPFASQGKGLSDRFKIFLVIAFETTSFANRTRRARIKRLLAALSKDEVLTIGFTRDGRDLAFELRASEDGDISVASEFLRGGYLFPPFMQV